MIYMYNKDLYPKANKVLLELRTNKANPPFLGHQNPAAKKNQSNKSLCLMLEAPLFMVKYLEIHLAGRKKNRPCRAADGSSAAARCSLVLASLPPAQWIRTWNDMNGLVSGKIYRTRFFFLQIWTWFESTLGCSIVQLGVFTGRV
jgi:hypothetical protein